MECLLDALCMPAPLHGSSFMSLLFFFAGEETSAYREVKC